MNFKIGDKVKPISKTWVSRCPEFRNRHLIIEEISQYRNMIRFKGYRFFIGKKYFKLVENSSKG